MHYFDENIAKEYGVVEAIMFQNIAYWVKNNRDNETNFHDGRYWTFNSRKALSLLFIYWTENQIKRILEKLYKGGLILKGNYNQLSYDKTNWYTLSDEGEAIANYREKAWSEITNHDAKKSKAWSEVTNRAGKVNQPIPDIKPDNKLNNIPHVEASKKVDIDLIVEEFNNLGTPFRKVQKLTPNRKKKASERLKEMGSTEEFISVIRSLPKYPFLRGEGSRGWVATFDFLIANSENWVKIKEGIYDNDKQQTSRSESYGQRNTHSKVQDEFGEEGAKAILRSTI